MSLDEIAKQLLREAITLHGSMNAVVRATGIHESVLKRIKNGQTKNPHAKTIGLLTKAAHG